MPEIDKTHWHKIASWYSVISNMNTDDNAKAIVNAWKKGEALENGINLDHLFSSSNENNQVSERGSPAIDVQTWIDWSAV